MRRNLIRLFCTGIILLYATREVVAQSPASSGKVVKTDKIRDAAIPAAPGTYQFIVTPSENGDPFTNDILVMIENYRDDTEERILPLTQLTKVRIPSRASIQDPAFRPLKEIVYTPNSKPLSQSR